MIWWQRGAIHARAEAHKAKLLLKCSLLWKLWIVMRRNNTYISYASGDDLCARRKRNTALTISGWSGAHVRGANISIFCHFFGFAEMPIVVTAADIRHGATSFKTFAITARCHCMHFMWNSFQASSHFSAFAVSLGKWILSDRLFAPIRSAIDQRILIFGSSTRSTRTNSRFFFSEIPEREKRNPTWTQLELLRCWCRLEHAFRLRFTLPIHVRLRLSVRLPTHQESRIASEMANGR